MVRKRPNAVATYWLLEKGSREGKSSSEASRHRSTESENRGTGATARKKASLPFSDAAERGY
jgi:hypothetical protein